MYVSLIEDEDGAPFSEEVQSAHALAMYDNAIELAEAWAALPDSVAGDAAPEGATLADRIKALVSERDFHRNSHAFHHKKDVL